LERGTRFAHDSLVEGAGFEPSVPLVVTQSGHVCRRVMSFAAGLC
jgi:hypothetical protein